MAGRREAEGRVYVGTSGWQYDSWVDPFYEGEAPSLASYARRLSTVEINGTFYGLPDTETVREWAESVDAQFAFSVKASRYLTHMKKLKDPAEPLGRLLTALEPLSEKLHVLLVQLPPRWRCNPDRLRAFVRHLPEGLRCAFEFRDPSWYSREVYQILRDENLAFCIYHLQDHHAPREVTADYVYIRLHGAAGKYQGSYAGEQLAGWAGAISSWSRAGKDVYVYFDNDQEAAAPADALRLREMV